MNVTRRRLLIAGRTGLLGLAGVAFAAAARTGTNSLTGEAKKQKGESRNSKKRKQKNQSKKGPRHHKQKNNGGKGKGNGKGIRLRTGSVLSESLISEEGGRLSAHMLLPFEEFPSEAALAEAVAEAEELGLFILPEDPGAGEVSPAA